MNVNALLSYSCQEEILSGNKDLNPPRVICQPFSGETDPREEV